MNRRDLFKSIAAAGMIALATRTGLARLAPFTPRVIVSVDVSYSHDFDAWLCTYWRDDGSEVRRAITAEEAVERGFVEITPYPPAGLVPGDERIGMYHSRLVTDPVGYGGDVVYADDPTPAYLKDPDEWYVKQAST